MPGTNDTKQDKVECLLRYIAEHVYKHGYQPSVRELARMMGWNSTGYVHKLLTDNIKGDSSGNAMQSRAIQFDWKAYLPKNALSWDGRKAPRLNPRRRIAAKRRVG